MARDLVWDAMVTVAGRLRPRAELQGLKVQASRRRSWLRLEVTEGLEAVDNWTDVFEPVRRRHFLTSNWSGVQPVQDAAASIGRFLDERPDRT